MQLAPLVVKMTIFINKVKHKVMAQKPTGSRHQMLGVESFPLECGSQFLPGNIPQLPGKISCSVSLNRVCP